MNPKADFYFLKNSVWQEALIHLRGVMLASGLTEEVKWGVPCYTLNGANVALLHVFKSYCAILFNKGVLLKDAERILVQQTENVQSARQLRFTHLQEIIAKESIIRSYLKEAIEIEKSGAKVPLKPTKAYPVAEEFQQLLNQSPQLKKAFEALTPGRQRGYLLHFSSAKQSKTRQARALASVPKILAGKGVDEA